MRKRRFLAWLMTMVMAIGLMPATALADEPTVPQVPVENLSPDPVTVTSNDTNVAKLSKTATYNEETGYWDVKLSVEATQPIESQPVEIVLVLDSSGSMAWCTTDKPLHDHDKSGCRTNCGMEEHSHSRRSGCYNWLTGELTCKKTVHTHVDTCYTCGLVEHAHKGGEACSMVTETSKSRMDIVKDKAKEMVGNIITIGGNVKIGVVDFDSEGYSSGSGALARIPLTEATAANKETIEKAIDAMKAEGGTWPDAGLNVADKMLKAGDPYAKKVVILLADGDADGSHGTAAETKATTMKQIVNGVETGVEFYTIGFMTDAGMLSNIASEPKAEHNFTTTNEQALAGIFANIVKRLSAMISDPMGPMVDLVAGTPAVSGSATTDVGQNGQTGLVVKSDQQIEWNKQGGLKSGEEVILDYSVSLDEAELLKLDAGSHEVALNGDAKLNYSYDHKGGKALFPVPKDVVETGQLVQKIELDGTVDNGRTVTGNKMIVSVSGFSKNANFTWNTPAATINADGTEYKYVETTYDGVATTDLSMAAAAGVHTVVHKYTSVVDQNFDVAKALTKVDNTEVKEIKDGKVYDKNDKEVAIAKDSVLTYKVTLTNEGDALTNDTVVVNDSKFTSNNVSITSVTVNGTPVAATGYTVDKTAGTLTINNVTLEENAAITVTYTYTVTEADVTAGKVENAASVENNTNPTDPEPEVVVPINNSTLVSSKTRVTEVSGVTWTTADQKEPAYNTDATPKIPKNESITLLFAVNVKNSIVNGAGVPLDYTVSDSNATYVGYKAANAPKLQDGAYTGTLTAGAEATLYFTKVFEAKAVTDNKVKNVAIVNGKDTPSEVPVTPLNNELSIAKERIDSEDAVPQDIKAKLAEKQLTVTYAANTDGKIEVPYNGSVTLLYKVTVTNAVPTQTYALRGATPGLDYNVVDAGAVYVGGDAQSGTLTNDHSAVMYFAKTFNKDTVGVDGAGNTVVTNTATLGAGKPADTEETPAVVKVTVTFNTQGGSAVASQTFDKGGKATEPDDPTRNGYDFTGWYTTENGDTEFDFDDPVNADTTVYAQWISKGQLSIDKERATTAPTLTSGTVPTGVTYGNVEIPYAGSVTLLYKVTVTNTTPKTLSLRTPVVPAGGNAYTVVEDNDATYVGYYAANGVAAPTSEEGTTVSGVLGPDESIDLYFTKTFVAKDVKTSNNGTVVTNTAKLDGTNEEASVETSAVVKVKVTFDTQGGSAVASQTFDKGGKATEPDDPTRDGYDFTGWYTTANEGTKFNFDNPVNADTTVYAQWIPKGQLSIDKERATTAPALTRGTVPEGVEYGDVKIPYAGEVTLLYKVTVTNRNPVPQVATFKLVPGGSAYTVVDNGATYVGYSAANGVAAPTSVTGTTVTGELGPGKSIDLYFTKTFKAENVENGKVTNTATLGEGKPTDTEETPAKVMVTVDFDLNYSGATGAPDSQEFEQGCTADEPVAPTRTNYTFVGWFEENSNTAFDFDTEVNEDKTLYAHWQLNPPTVEQLGDIALEVICDQHANKDCDAVYPSLTEATAISKTGFIIGEVEGKTVKVTLKGADLFIPSEHFADENKKNITELTFEYDDDTKTWSPVSDTHLVTVIKGRPPISVPGFAIYVTAKEDPAEKVNINFHPGEADTEENYGKMPFVQVDKGGEYTITPNLYEYEGHKFVNWKVLSTAELEDTYYDDKDTIDSVETSMTLVAQWEPIDVKIKFDPNASSLLVSGEMNDQTVKYGVEARLNKNQFERIDGYAFVGWNTQPDGEGTSYTDKASITVSNVEGITLYAQWEYASVVLTYYANGGSGIMWPETYSKGAKVTVKECAFKAPTGQEFVGWSTTATGDVDYYPGETIDGIEKPMQLYAIWKGKTPVPSQYILTYHANDGSGNKKEETYLTTDDLVIVKDDNMFSMFGKPVGKKFTGWSFSANGNAEVKPGDMFLIRQNTDLYAVWEDIEDVSVQKTIENKQEGPYQFGDEVTFRIVVRNDSNETVNDLLLVEEPGAGLKPVEDPWSWDAAKEHLMVPIMLLHGFIEDILDLADEPVVDEPVVDEPVVDEPVVDEPKAETPVVEGPKAEAPVVEGPKAEAPVVDEPVADEPVVDEPVADEPVVDEPVADEPAEEVEVDEVTETPAAMLAFEDPERNDAYLVEAEDGSLYVVIPELAPGEEIEFYYTVEVVDTHEAYDPADYTNKAYIDGIKDAKDEVLVPVTGIEIEKSVEKNSKPEPGEWVIYEIVVTNTGAFDLTDVTVTEMPDDEYVDGYFCDENGKEDEDAVDATTYFIDELGAGEDVTLYYRAKVSSKAKDGDELLNDVTVTGTLDNDEKVTATDSNDDVIVEKESRGGIPSKNRPTKPSKVEEVLNTEDHFQYVQGYPDNTVGPERNITRAEATVIFFRLLNDSVRAEYLDAENAFPDVNMNDWFNLGVSTMENGGFVSGYDDGLFRPNANITRAELATIISNFDDLEPAAENKFADVEGHWAEKYINSAAEKGWLSGYEDGLFRPNQYITRAETMSMINRVLDRRVDADGLHAAAKQWKDNPESKWYYYAVLEATNYHEYERADVSDYENWTAIKAEKIWEN